MPRIRVEWLKGRTEKQRQELAERITDAFTEVVAVRPDMVNIIFEEISPELQYKAGVPWSKHRSE